MVSFGSDNMMVSAENKRFCDCIKTCIGYIVIQSDPMDLQQSTWLNIYKFIHFRLNYEKKFIKFIGLSQMSVFLNTLIIS